ncbi:type I phosphodiesterase/nucleotide pyrophosphatase [Mycolicibacter sinensis]|uniref:Type I phosphodiesterase/nucleotide pyrophosphatase n=1 Tax=Mycolicibacter sinensis (strain JDM601) TaxID=875328 RepID=F5YWH0_MYCSD|nr:alkaline phosphatase family protein [Mycolicibacter sinensis]AEF34071.1 type I phosphodiesterase/nucleotide pyrophosphatase [Mycolicibacter sinensis]
MTTLKQILCGTAVAGLVAGAGAAVEPQVGLSTVTADWLLAAEHVLLLGTDGTNLDKILEYAYNDDSGFKMLMDRGVTAATTIAGHQTMSTPSWSTILTGVWDDKHGVVSNVYRPEPYTTWPSVFNLIEYHKPEVDTTVISGRGLFTEMASTGGYPADNIIGITGGSTSAEMDALVTDETIARILATTENPDTSTFMFSYQSQVDHAGHSYSGGSEEYKEAVINVGANFKQILDAVAQAEAATGDRWTIIAVTDHGHQQTVTLPGFSLGHGFQTPNETSSFIMFSLAGNDDQAGGQNLSYQTVDITPTILQAFGIQMRSDFDGVPMQTDPEILNGFIMPVDLKQSLTDAINSYGYPDIGTNIMLSIRALAGGAGFFIGSYLLPPISNFLQTIIDQDIFLISGLAQGAQWLLNTVGGVVADVATDLGRAVAYLTGAGVIPPEDAPLPLPGSAEFSDSVAALLAGHTVAVPDLVDADLPLLVDIDALVG